LIASEKRGEAESHFDSSLTEEDIFNNIYNGSEKRGGGRCPSKRTQVFGF
jgi:hypothetical protein